MLKRDEAEVQDTGVTTSVPPPDFIVDDEEPLYLQQSTYRRTRVDLGTLGDDERSITQTMQILVKDVLSSLSMFTFFVKLAVQDIFARKGMYALSFCSVFFVVVMCVTMLSVLSSLPIVFLRLGEADSGEADLIIKPGGLMRSAASINYYAVKQVLAGGAGALQLHAPRIEWRATGIPRSWCGNVTHVSDLWYDQRYFNTSYRDANVCEEGCTTEWCVGGKGPDFDVVAFDATLEKSIGFGSDFVGPRHQLRHGETAISTELAESLEVNVGDKIVVTSDVGDVLREALSHVSVAPSHSNESSYTRNSFIIMELTVVDIVEVDPRKFPRYDSFALVNYDYIVAMVADALMPSITEKDREAVAAVDPRTCATAVYFCIPSSMRNKVYVNSNYEAIRKGVVQWAQQIILRLGSNQVSASTPLLSFLKTMSYFSTFVGLIMSMVLLALSTLSVALIYSLLNVGIETRQYELGIQRMIGFTRANLVSMVLTNAYLFTLPAWLLGLIGGQILYSIVRAILNHVVDIALNSLVSGASIGWATFLGLLIPFLSAIFPIISLVRLRLPDALSASRKGGSVGLVYKITRGDSREINGIMFGLGLVIGLFGFLLYYLFPLSLLTMNLSLMFYIFFAVLLGMLVGLLLLASNFERMVEMYISYIFLFWESNAVFSVMQKSLASHRLRNRKTTLMYALAVGFVVFISVAFDLQIKTMQYSIRRNRGTEVVVDIRGGYYRDSSNSMDDQVTRPHSSAWDTDEEKVLYELQENLGARAVQMVDRKRGVYLSDLAALEEFLAPEQLNGMITGITYSVRTLDSTPLLWTIGSVYLRTLGRFIATGNGIRPFPPNFYQVTFPEYLIVGHYSGDVGSYGVSGALYSEENMHGLVVATTLYRNFAFDSVSDVALAEGSPQVSTNNTQRKLRFSLFHPTAALDSSPSILMTKFPNTMGEIIAALPTALRISGSDYMSCAVLPLSAIHVRVPNPEHYTLVKKKIRAFFMERGQYPRVRDVDASLDDIQLASKILHTFFIIAQVMIMVVCFFSLMCNMAANVLGSSKEIGILLCLGMSHFQVYRVYVWEAFVLVIAAGMLGVVVGMVVGYTIQLQNSLYSQLPLAFAFPYVQIIIMFSMGAGSALASSIAPVAYLLHLPSVVHILRRTLS